MIYLFLTREAEDSSKAKGPASMRTFTESQKSQKTVKSMIETKSGDKIKEQGGKKNKNAKKEGKCRRWSWTLVIIFTYISSNGTGVTNQPRL